MEDQPFQIFIQVPDPKLTCRAFKVSPSQTILHLKLALSPPHTTSQTLDCFYFTFNGKPLPDYSKLSDSAIPPFSTLFLQPRVLGGGGDGGATGAESRDCYLNMYAVKKPDKVDPNETRLSKWTSCALSAEPLKHPCVIDRLGNVYNKEALVEALVMKKLPKEFGHVKGLKDMIPIQLSTVPGLQFDETSFDNKFQCPITGLEFNGKYKFFALRGCGHVLSAKALKEVQSDACHVCHFKFLDSDKIVINGNAEDVAMLRQRMEEDMAKSREKREKKVRNGEGVTGAESGSAGSGLSGSKHTVDGECKVLGMTRSEENGKVATVDRIKGLNGSSKRFKAVDRAPANATKEVYASIFTSSKKSGFKETFSCRSLPLGRN